MVHMGKYCKVYSLKDLRQFTGWTEKVKNTRTEKSSDSQAIEPPELRDNMYLYMQENYVVTKGVFMDERVVFDNVTPEWIAFCKDTLNFKAPSVAKIIPHSF